MQIQIVTAEWLVENRNLTIGFIQKHARALGSFSKPRRFILSNVDAYLIKIADRSRSKVMTKLEKKAANKAYVNQIFREAVMAVNKRSKRGIPNG